MSAAPEPPRLVLGREALTAAHADQEIRRLRRRGRSASRVVGTADRRSGSVGESRSRAVLIEAGLPLPELQLEVRRPDGVLVGRSDFGWRRERVVGEFDGRVEYGRLLRQGQDPGDAVFAGRRREDAIRDELWGVVRWVWAELDAPAQLVTRVARALGRRAR